MARLRVALCQLDTVVGDIDGNCERIIETLARAELGGADLAALPELAITGYPPEDLLLKPAFVADNLAALEKVASATSSCVALVGFVDVVDVDESDAGLFNVRRAAMQGAPRMLRNALAVCAQGRVAGVYHKRRLPNYGVFDEERWFAPGTSALQLYEVAGINVGVSVCEDAWFPGGPIAEQGIGGAAVVVNVNSSPYSMGRVVDRLAVARQRGAEGGCAVVYVNQVGGQDELVFDGGSFVIDATGTVVAAAEQFTETMLLADVEAPTATERSAHSTAAAPTPHALPVVRLSGAVQHHRAPLAAALAAPLSEEEEVYGALVLGTRDYLAKNGFSDAVIGLSGGIDSSLVAAVAVDALGAGHVHGVAMPSRYSSEGSLVDARALAENLGIELATIPIEDAHVALNGLLAPVLGGPPRGLPDENLQSRIRGILLMALSNAKGWIVLTTGNKSEMATGYSTLYGDSAGGFAVIKDVPKTLVYRLCVDRNRRAGAAFIPGAVLVKAPSAELRPDQRDDESLPPYELLDPVLDALVDGDGSIADVVAEGYDPEVVTAVARLVDAAEYKRRQSPPGVRISLKAFGKDRRMPITNRYRDRSTAPPVPAALETEPSSPGTGRGQ